MLLYETPPVVVKADTLTADDVAGIDAGNDTDGETEDGADDDSDDGKNVQRRDALEGEAPASSLPLVLGITGGVVVLGGGGTALFLNRKKIFKPKSNA